MYLLLPRTINWYGADGIVKCPLYIVRGLVGWLVFHLLFSSHMYVHTYILSSNK